MHAIMLTFLQLLLFLSVQISTSFHALNKYIYIAINHAFYCKYYAEFILPQSVQ